MLLLVLAVAGVLAQKKKVDSSLWIGSSPESAAQHLLDTAKNQAGKDFTSNLAIARVLYLAGKTDEADAIVTPMLGKKADPAILMGIGRIHYEVGEWDRAKSMFEEVMRRAPKESTWIAEIGAYYNLQGDRTRAEQLFARSFDIAPADLGSTVMAAGSYVGVAPE
jgi:Flp pilus assembly protein TadD